ncbi:hypothetical protein VTN31DRAFT_3425 [Thermomyces dupontii]|uniref:uncharacterized protein n=1 Tax=Talaromyces thermophilus TaxID=28565 RepID=UPI0037448397
MRRRRHQQNNLRRLMISHYRLAEGSMLVSNQEKPSIGRGTRLSMTTFSDRSTHRIDMAPAWGPCRCLTCRHLSTLPRCQHGVPRLVQVQQEERGHNHFTYSSMNLNL